LRIKDAVENALQRDADSMYAPLVVSHNDGETRLLDMYTLLTAQSHILDNANSIFGRMNAIEDALQAKLPFDKLFDMVMDSMMSVVPYHRAGLFVLPSRWMNLSFTHPLVHRMSDKMRETRLLRTISDLRQPIVVDDIQAHPYRHALASSLGSVRAWIGLPLQTIFGIEGVLSLSRYSLTAFTREEVELAKSFIDYFGLVLNEPSDSQPKSISLEKTRRKLSLLAGG
jgi:GAF domain-containing protein